MGRLAAASGMLTPAQLLERAGSRAVPPALSADWPAGTGVEYHTGRLKAGDVFFALPGESGHGIRFADDALGRGASFIVSDVAHPRGLKVDDPAALLLELGRQARKEIRGTVIGVTGSAGKTTSKDLLASLLDAAASPGNLNTTLALACTLVRARLTEPARDLVLELGIDHPGEMAGLLALTTPDTGMLTSIAPSHLDGLGDVKTVASEKRQLLDSARLRYASDQALTELGDLTEGLRTYGLSAGVDWHGTIETDDTGSRVLQLRGEHYPLSQPGSAYATNVCGALAVALDAGLEPELLRQRLANVQISPGRLQLRRCAGRWLIDDSYNSNPLSARAALEVLQLSSAPRSAVLGDMRELGERSAALHEEIGRLTTQLDFVIAVGDNAAHIRRGNPQALTAPDTEAALQLLERLPIGGTVLVKASRSLGFERIVAALEERS